MTKGKIWNLRTDPTWIDLVKIQTSETGRASPGAYVRDLVWLVASNPTIKKQVMKSLRGVWYGQPG